MERIRNFTDVIEWQQDQGEEDILHVYSNDRVDLTALSGIVESGQWDEMRLIYGFLGGIN